jgi:hypothetical protein
MSADIMRQRIDALHSNIIHKQIWGANYINEWCRKLKCAVVTANGHVKNGKYADAMNYYALANVLCARIHEMEKLDAYATDVTFKLHNITDIELNELEKQAKDRFHTLATQAIQTWKITPEEKDIEKLLGCENSFHMQDVESALP